MISPQRRIQVGDRVRYGSSKGKRPVAYFVTDIERGTVTIHREGPSDVRVGGYKGPLVQLDLANPGRKRLTIEQASRVLTRIKKGNQP